MSNEFVFGKALKVLQAIRQNGHEEGRCAWIDTSIRPPRIWKL